MSSFVKQRTTYHPIFSLLDAETERKLDELTERWKDNKFQELNFIGVVGALLSGVFTSTGSWSTILPNGICSPWTVRACWYCGLIIALTSVLVAPQQSIRLHRSSCHVQANSCIRRLLSVERLTHDGTLHPRKMQILAWQLSGWLLSLSFIALLAGLFILVWTSTLTSVEQIYADWWNGEAKLAFTFTVITVVLITAFYVQQWTLYSWHGKDDSDQRHQQL